MITDRIGLHSVLLLLLIEAWHFLLTLGVQLGLFRRWEKFEREIWVWDLGCSTTTTTTTTSSFLALNIQISHHLQIARLIEAGGV